MECLLLSLEVQLPDKTMKNARRRTEYFISWVTFHLGLTEDIAFTYINISFVCFNVVLNKIILASKFVFDISLRKPPISQIIFWRWTFASLKIWVVFTYASLILAESQVQGLILYFLKLLLIFWLGNIFWILTSHELIIYFGD